MTRQGSWLRRSLEALLPAVVLAALASKLLSPGPPTASSVASVDMARTGRVIPAVPVQTDTGVVDQSFDDGVVRVVLLYSPRCSACVRQKPVWYRLADRLPQKVEVLAVSLEPGDTAAFLQHPRIKTPRVASLATLRRAFPHRGVPTTVVVSGEAETVLWVERTFSEPGIELIQRAASR